MSRKRFQISRAAAAGLLALTSAAASAADFDLCGCEGHPESLGAFDSNDPSTWPPGTTGDLNYWSSNRTITFTLPEDGVMIFDSMRFRRQHSGIPTTYRFRPNANNTPVTLLVAGDVRIDDYAYLDLSGGGGGNGSSTIAGVGGSAGPGGFRGGDGASQSLNQSADGGEGIGPGGGTAGTGSPLTSGGAGTFAGRLDLLPLIGGAGGGGGGSSSTGNCSGGGGGGGGGALLMVANRTINILSNGRIWAEGGSAGGRSGTCAGYGGHGSGGAVRLVAKTVTGGGYVLARGGAGTGNNDGIIRIEAITNTLTSDGSRVDPAAIRTSLIGPLVNPVASWVGITAVDGEAVPEVLTGSTGGIDVMVPAPGLITFQVETAGVPGGTEVAVALKPRVGGAAFRGTGLLDPESCTSAGECIAFVTFDLPSGAYSAEAEATFLAP
jgi:hypothetical protein